MQRQRVDSGVDQEEEFRMAYAGKSGDRAPASVRRVPPRSSVGPMVTGLAIGLLVGAGVALLFAPERGADTRRGIRRGFRRAGLRGRDAWADLRLELKRARRELLRARRRRQVEATEDDS